MKRKKNRTSCLRLMSYELGCSWKLRGPGLEFGVVTEDTQYDIACTQFSKSFISKKPVRKHPPEIET